MVITLGNLLIWLIIAALVGFVGELLARRRTPFGIVGAMVVGFIAILLVVGVLHWHIDGEPSLNGVPLIPSILAAAVHHAGTAHHQGARAGLLPPAKWR